MGSPISEMFSDSGKVSSTRCMYVLVVLFCIIGGVYLFVTDSFTAEKGFFISTMFGIASSGQAMRGYSDTRRYGGYGGGGYSSSPMPRQQSSPIGETSSGQQRDNF